MGRNSWLKGDGRGPVFEENDNPTRTAHHRNTEQLKNTG